MDTQTSPVTIDPARQEQARVYARIQRRMMLVDLALGTLYLVAWLASGASAALRDALQRLTINVWLLVALFGLVFGGLYVLFSLPLSYYSEFILPHRFNQSTQTLKGWATDQLKGLLVEGLLGGLLLEIIYLVLRLDPLTWWLWAAGVLLVFNVLLANLAPVLIAPLFNKFIPLGEEYSELRDRLTRLAERAHTRVKGVYQFDLSQRTRSANAAVMGWGNTRRIIIGDTLLTQFTPDEIETVLAHELGHQVRRHIPLGILANSLLTLAGMALAGLVLAWGVAGLKLSGPQDVAAMPLLGLALGLYGLLTMPLSNGVSRWMERQADEYALQATGKGAVYATALVRLANQNLAEADPEPWVEFWLYSHPALGKRIRRAQEYDPEKHGNIL